jgi:hypothetical protein
MEPEKLSLKELLVRLPIGQLWGLIVVITGLIVGAARIGWSFRGTIEEAQIGRLMAEKSALEGRVASIEQDQKDKGEELRQQQEKANFLTAYLRYIMARDQLDLSIPLDAARQALDGYIEGRVKQESVIIHKGQGRRAIAQLADGSQWPIPPELSATSVPPR